MRGKTARSTQPKGEGLTQVNQVLEGLLAERKPASLSRKPNVGLSLPHRFPRFRVILQPLRNSFQPIYHRGSNHCSRGLVDAVTLSKSRLIGVTTVA
jgi:hypothetical protein